MRVVCSTSTNGQEMLQHAEGLRMEPDHVVVIFWPISVPISADCWQLLDAAERQRAERFHRSQHRERFVAAHGGMRCLLAAFIGCSAGELRFLDDANKKPRLDGHSPRFNLTHSGDWAALALARDVDVGIDIEKIRLVEPGLPQRYFSLQEQAALSTLAGQEDWLEGFFRAWTRKEALLKAVGAGLSLPLADFTVTLEREVPARLVASSRVELQPKDWGLLHLGNISGYMGALAAPSTATSVSIFVVEDGFLAKDGIDTQGSPSDPSGS
jgi:4'-phosphopantetheinyl transferase